MSELVRISEPVATELEITELANRQMKAPGGGKALLFEKPTINGRLSQFPVAINTMGSERRMARAIGLDSVDEIAHQMQLILKAKPPTSLREGWSLLKQGIDLLHARPKRVTDGPCKEVLRYVADRVHERS
jgi:4-hydroxy-3-polyprenylbenzoate decarboxylase